MGAAPYTEESDYTMPVAFARAVRRQGVPSMSLVSSQMACASSLFGYLRTLGRREQAFQELGFTALHVYRPSALGRGERSQERWKERLLMWTMPRSWVTEVEDFGRLIVSRCRGPGAVLEASEVLDLSKQVK